MFGKKQKKPLETVKNSVRRGFLKKAAYVAPTIVALGALMKPTETKADFGPPPSGPDWPDDADGSKTQTLDGGKS